MVWNVWDYALLILFFALIGYYIRWSIGGFKRKGIKTLTTYPLIGNMKDSLLGRLHFLYLLNKAYATFPNEKYVGFYQFIMPGLIVKDIEIIKNITVKDFDHFESRQTTIDESIDPLFGKNLLALSGQKWRDMRATLSPAFTSSKMRNMFNFVTDCGKHMTEFYLQKSKGSKKAEMDFIEIEMKDAFSRYTNDVIASTAFGIPIDSLSEPNNDFYLMGKEATTLTPSRLIKFLGFTSFPKLMKVLGITLFSSRIQNFFRKLVIGQMKDREEKNIIRQDMIHLLMEARKGTLKQDNTIESRDGFAIVEESSLGQRIIKRKWDDDDITAQVILFLLAGFDTSSTLLCFLAHEITLNADIQQKLQREIDDVNEKNQGELNYTDLQNMKYMDMVVSETLRKWPPGVVNDRQCVKPYTLPPSTPNSKPVQLNVKDGVWIPVFSIHRDPQYYNDPDKFDPERFSDENKSLIQPFTYLPFGAGPRNCIGSRFALMEIKSVLFYLLSKFDFVPTQKTANPLVLSNSSLKLSPEDGFWIGLKSRNKV